MVTKSQKLHISKVPPLRPSRNHAFCIHPLSRNSLAPFFLGERHYIKVGIKESGWSKITDHHQVLYPSDSWFSTNPDESLSIPTNPTQISQAHWQIQGVPPTRAPPTGSNSFNFAHIFAEKHTCQRSVPPPQWAGSPPTGNPGSATETNWISGNNYTSPWIPTNPNDFLWLLTQFPMNPYKSLQIPTLFSTIADDIGQHTQWKIIIQFSKESIHYPSFFWKMKSAYSHSQITTHKAQKKYKCCRDTRKLLTF